QVQLGSEDAYVRKLDFSGNVLWTRQFGSPAFDLAFGLATDPSGVYVTGFTAGALPGQTSAGFFDVFLRKYDAGCGVLCTQQFGIRGEFFSPGVLTVDASGIYAAGSVLLDSGKNDPLIGLFRKYDFSGNVLWQKSLPGTFTCGEALWGLSAYNNAVYMVTQS